MQRILDFWRRAGLIFLNTVLLLGLVEGAARVAERLHPEKDAITFGYAPYRMLKMTEAPWKLNREGFRAAEFDRYQDRFLVEFLGGSVCLGVGSNPGETLPERLEDALHRAGLERASVLNLCQGGATSAQELAIFLEFGLPLRPQVVLSFDGANDFMHPRPLGRDDRPNLPYRNREMQSRVDGEVPVLDQLAAVRVASRLGRRAGVAWGLESGMARGSGESGENGAVPVDQVLASYFYTLGVTRTLTEAQGGFHAVLLQPTLHFEKPWSEDETRMWNNLYPRDGQSIAQRAHAVYAAAQTSLGQWAQEHGTKFYDLTGVFAATPETIYEDSVHFAGERGYAMLAADLERKGLVARISERYRTWEQRQSAVAHGHAVSGVNAPYGRLVSQAKPR